ncbi:hypothetical protein CEUSTIGMA_g1423.t1 [Chlamydomonas eustigma]|uniref:Uncharacterized protein n=1 Tax=Chlamydomonas eustigma TaxID=1157962 RepID=A0A250WT23_9CHLO|nr:hypothetical protein CEUSTIGMA_g1423.t1 [Chlamydomonas eustigma]|eukprot:GAX73973.1 hypothetical protein CEUSTIGMA_g1423.t1 [Chlamydomonas eustigma]
MVNKRAIQEDFDMNAVIKKPFQCVLSNYSNIQEVCPSSTGIQLKPSANCNDQNINPEERWRSPPKLYGACNPMHLESKRKLEAYMEIETQKAKSSRQCESTDSPIFLEDPCNIPDQQVQSKVLSGVCQSLLTALQLGSSGTSHRSYPVWASACRNRGSASQTPTSARAPPREVSGTGSSFSSMPVDGIEESRTQQLGSVA